VVLQALQQRVFANTRAAAVRRLAFLLLLPALAFSGTLAFDFVYDDNLVIFEDPLVVGPFDLHATFTTPVRVSDLFLNYYRPVITMLYRVDWLLWGPNPAGFHLTNLLWHLFTTILVYFAAAETGASRLAAWLAALLFAVLPAHAEALGWIQGRVDLVPTALVLLAFLAFARGVRLPVRRTWPWSAAGGAAFLAALLAKESAGVLPLLAGLWVGIAPAERLASRRARAAMVAAVPLVLGGIAYVGLRRLALDGFVTFHMGLLAPGRRLAGLLAMVGEYVSVLAAPEPGLRSYHNGIPATPPAGLVVVGVLALAALLSVLTVSWRRWPAVALWTAWIPLTLAPVLLFVLNARAPEIGFYTGERFLYLPSVGWVVLTGALLARTIEGRPGAAWSPWGVAIAAALVLAYTSLTITRLLPWADPVEFYRATLAQPHLTHTVRVFIQNDLGRVYLERDDLSRAREALLEALRLDPQLAHAHNNLGVLLIREGRPEEARRWIEAAIRLDPRLASAYGNLATAYEAVGNPAAARQACQAGLRVAPDSRWLAERLARLQGNYPPQ